MPKTEMFGCVGRGVLLGFDFGIMQGCFCYVFGLPYRLASLFMCDTVSHGANNTLMTGNTNIIHFYSLHKITLAVA